jgi:hypothetical protein
LEKKRIGVNLMTTKRDQAFKDIIKEEGEDELG